jgi:hypothetical protein
MLDVKVLHAPMRSMDTFRMLDTHYDMIVLETEENVDLIESVYVRGGKQTRLIVV